jgi:hypothetical protein
MRQRTALRMVCVGLLYTLFGLGSSLAQNTKSSAPAARAVTSRQARLEAFLRHYVGPPDSLNRGTRYEAAFLDLSGHGTREAVVYLTGEEWCGSGGCTTLVLAPRGTSYEVIGYLTTTWLPIRVLARKSHGWHDVGVWAAGAGIVRPHEAVYSFNGRKYPNTPSPRTGEERLPGEVAISANASEAGKPLYP